MALSVNVGQTHFSFPLCIILGVFFSSRRPRLDEVMMEERFSKPGLGEAAYEPGGSGNGQLRLLVHCAGCPPFLCVVAGTHTIAQLQRDIEVQHRELFAGGDIPTVKVRWLEDSQRHALAANSTCSAVLADREKVYACSGLDPTAGVFEHPGRAGSVPELISRWRNTCIDTAARLSAISQQDGREEEVFDAGGLQVLLSISLHSGHLMPGDVAIQDVHAGLRSLLTHEDSARRIMASACEGQVIALLQCPDPDLAGTAAFMCSRLAVETDSHPALLSWAAPARLAKAVQLSGNAAVRFDAMTTLRLMADNPDCHAALLSTSVIKVLLRAADDGSDAPVRLKALRAITAMASTGSPQTQEGLKRWGAVETVRHASDASENDVRRAAAGALAALNPHAGDALPALEAGGGLSEVRNTKTPSSWDPAGEASTDLQPSRDFSSLAQEGLSMASGGRGQEFLAAGGIAKLALLASSPAPLAAGTRPDHVSGDW